MKRNRFLSTMLLGSILPLPKVLSARSLTRAQRLVRDKAYLMGQPDWGLTLASICKVESSYGLDMRHDEESYGWFGLSEGVIRDYLRIEYKMHPNIDDFIFRASANFEFSYYIAFWHWLRCHKWAGELGFVGKDQWFVANRIWNGGKNGWRRPLTKRHAGRVADEVRQLRKEGFKG